MGEQTVVPFAAQQLVPVQPGAGWLSAAVLLGGA